jgi:SprT protein
MNEPTSVYDIRQKMVVSKELQLRIESVVLDCLVKAQKHYGESKITKIPEIRYDTKGRAAGQAWYNDGNPFIKINPILLNENVETVINQTVPHEIAHIVADMIWNRINIRPHGREWASVMYLFGKRPNRCHSMDTTSIRMLRHGGKEYLYKCNCQTFKFSKTRHTKSLGGVVYTCKRCKSHVEYVSEVNNNNKHE